MGGREEQEKRNVETSETARRGTFGERERERKVGKCANSRTTTMMTAAATGRAAFAEKRRRCTRGNENGKKHSGAN